jgi:hypothetical protein
VTTGCCDTAPFASAFALPSAPTAATWLDALGAAGLTVQRARMASRLGDPDPFPLRALAARAASDAAVHIDEAGGTPLDPDAADVVLLEAAARRRAPEVLHGLFTGRLPGARVRALAVAPPLSTQLRYPRSERGPVPTPRSVWHPIALLGQPDVATVRVLLALPGDRLAAGTDYGVSVLSDSWSPATLSRGARREGYRAQALGVRGDQLCVATDTAWLEIPLDGGPIRGRRLPPDGEDGRDDVRCMLAVGGELWVGWRCRFEGASGPPDVLSMAIDPAGFVWLGTLGGGLWIANAGGPVRAFEDVRGRPVRHMTFASDVLWVAAAGALHRFDGATWSRRAGEPTALATGPDWRLAALRDGRVEVDAGDPEGWPVPLDLPVTRPWCLAFARGALWVGAPGGLLEVRG